jgi:hypothetical protein
MKHLDFIMWMICFPLSISLQFYLRALTDRVNNKVTEHSDFAIVMTAIINIAIWALVGYNLY